MSAAYASTLDEHNEQRALAEAMVPMLGKLYRSNTVVCSVFGNELMNVTVIGLLKIHRAVRHVVPHLPAGISIHETMPFLTALVELGTELGPCHVDLGKLSVAYTREGGSIDDDAAVAAYVLNHVQHVLGAGPMMDLGRGRDVVLFGFGRIGRLVARVLLEKTGAGDMLALRAIVVRPHMDPVQDIRKRASLLKRDSSHGKFKGMIEVDEAGGFLIANGVRIKMIYAKDRTAIDYTEYGIEDAILIDNTGIWRTRETLAEHAKCPGISKVVLTAPGKGDVPNIVVGVNSDNIDMDETVYAAASCTTNAVCPPLQILDALYGIDSVHIETIHAFTNDQNLLDNFHKKERRGRAAPLNLVLTETGAAKAVAGALPQLAGKVTGSAIRCPTPDVSMAILIVTLKRDTTVDEVNNALRHAALAGPLQQQVMYSDSREAASTDMVSSTATTIVDSPSTIVHGNRTNIYCWYDNELGYVHQVVRLVEIIGGVQRVVIPARFDDDDE